MWTGSSQIAINVSRLEKLRETLQPISVRVSNDVLTYNVTIVVVFLWYIPDGVYVARDENVNLCGVDTKIVTHSGRRSQLLLSAMRCGHPSSYIGSSVDRTLVLMKSTPICVTSRLRNTYGVGEMFGS